MTVSGQRWEIGLPNAYQQSEQKKERHKNIGKEFDKKGFCFKKLSGANFCLQAKDSKQGENIFCWR